MGAEPKLSHTAAMILQSLDVGYRYGLSIMELAGLPSGTVYPALRRLEQDLLVSSHWESQDEAAEAGRPPRKYYQITPAGEAALAASRVRYPHLAGLFASKQVVS